MAVICCWTERCSLAFSWCSRSHVSFAFSDLMNYTQHNLVCAMLISNKCHKTNSFTQQQHRQATCSLNQGAINCWVKKIKCLSLKMTMPILYFSNGAKQRAYLLNKFYELLYQCTNRTSPKWVIVFIRTYQHHLSFHLYPTVCILAMFSDANTVADGQSTLLILMASFHDKPE